MGLIKKRIGEYLVQSDVRNSNSAFGEANVRGISTGKAFIQTKANLQGVSLSNYKVVAPNHFAYVPDTSRRGNKISLAYNDSSESYLVSSISVVFGIKPEKEGELLGEYLFLYFNRPEFDRYARFNSWGSAREAFSWEDLCNTEIILPDIQTQRNCVNVYLGMQENLDSITSSIDQMNKACAVLLDKLKQTSKWEPLKSYIEPVTDKNTDGKARTLVGVSKEGFVTPRQKRSNESLSKCSIVHYHDFVYNASRINIGSIMFSSSKEEMCCSEEYVVFRIIDEQVLLPEYLFLWLKRSECGRYISFRSMDSVRNRIYLEELKEISIPIPDMEIQRSIAAIYRAALKRSELANSLQELLENVCPILVRGAIEEGGR